MDLNYSDKWVGMLSLLDSPVGPNRAMALLDEASDQFPLIQVDPTKNF